MQVPVRWADAGGGGEAPCLRVPWTRARDRRDAVDPGTLFPSGLWITVVWGS